MYTMENILKKLSKVKPNQSDTGYTACCPAHDDKNPSLSITQGTNGTILVKCHAGCSPEAICTALGIELSDLFPNKLDGHGKRRTERSIQKKYDYCDRNGNLVFQVVRTHPRGFYQRRPDGNGGWINNLEGVCIGFPS